MSNLILNVKKMELMAVGTQPRMIQSARENGLKIVDKIKFIGSFTHDSNPELDPGKNLEHPWTRFDKITNIFTMRHTSSIGTMIALNSLCLPLFTHNMFNFIPDKEGI